MILVFDTETNSLPLWKAPDSDDRQPHLVQIGAIVCTDDGKPVVTMDAIIRPDGWEITPENAAIHGISHDRALAVGIPEPMALAWFGEMANGCHTRVAHNEDFDARIIRYALTRFGPLSIKAWERGFTRYCTMRATQDICALPPTEAMVRSGRTWNKPPKLAEAYRHLFGEELQGAHNALADCRAAMRIYFELQARAARAEAA